MTMQEACKVVRDGVRPGLRGPGCASIITPDGRNWGLASDYGDGDLVECYADDGTLLVRCDASQVVTPVDVVRWSCDELGDRYID